MKRYYRRPTVEEMLGLSRSTIYRMMQDGEFPRPVKIGRRAVGWSSEEIESWIIFQCATLIPTNGIYAAFK